MLRQHSYSKGNSAFITVLICTILYFFLMASWGLAEEKAGYDNAITVYNKNRQAVIDENQSANRSFLNEVALIKNDIALQSQKVAETTKELKRVESIIFKNTADSNRLSATQSRVSAVLFPMLSALSLMSSFLPPIKQLSALILVFLCITVLNVFLYLFFKQKPFFIRYKIHLIIALTLCIGAIASPLFAAEQTKREQVISKLDTTEKILSKSEYERFIAILEEKQMNQILIPELQSGDPLFKVFRNVTIETPEYWFTLAALYTHEQQNGKAIDAVKRITSSTRLVANADHQNIILNSFKYLLQEKQTQIISSIIDSLGGAVMEVSTSLELAILLKQNGMQTSADKTLSYAIIKANSVFDLTILAKFFIDRKEYDKSSEALEKAIIGSKTKEEIMALAETAITLGNNKLITKFISTVDVVLSEYQDKMDVVDVFIKHDRKEEANILFGTMIKAGMVKSTESTKKLLYLIEASLVRNFIPQASDASEKLIFMLGGFSKAKSFLMKTETHLATAQGLPDANNIMLPQFYGLSKEEQGRNDEAEEAYIRATLDSLTTIISSYGYTIPESLNDFYLLGRIWIKGNRADLIGQLDRVYSILEKQFMKNVAEKNQAQLKTLREEAVALKGHVSKLQNDLEKIKQRATKSYIKLVMQAGSTIATILFLLAALTGCIVLASNYCKELSMGKTFGFLMKFSETVGWLQVLSVLGLISGFFYILFAQLFLMLQMVQENTKRIATLFPALLPTAQEPIVEYRKEGKMS
ncbi:MAG: hypothetical protein V2B20_15795 [Pseudomonadota bacterium]